ncbi:hypothetical protein [Streptomyces sp. NPDC017673]|uniref:hypothetical protein n=1 Tax=unclassified Streptomyces TaxID=2593676 RepID=UPI0037B6D082
MSEESVPRQGGPAGRPKGLLEELMAALNAELSTVSALSDLQAGGPAPGTADETEGDARLRRPAR